MTVCHLRWSLAGVVVAVFCGCGDDASLQASARCPIPRANCVSDSGLPAEQDPVCVDVLDAYDLRTWPQRNEASQFVPGDIPTSGNVLAVGFAEDAHSGIGWTAWLDSDADLDVRFDVALAKSSQDPQSIYVVLLLDGIAQSVRHNGTTATATPFELHPGQHAGDVLTVASASVDEGAHSGVLLLWTARGHAISGRFFTVLKHSTRFVDRPPPQQGARITIGPNGLTSATTAGRSLLVAGTLPQRDGSLPLSFAIAPAWTEDCKGLRKRLLVTAFLDNEQVALIDDDVRPAFELSVGEAMKFTTSVKVPIDGEPHTFQVWLLTGDGAYAEAPQGEVSAWQALPQQLGIMTWQDVP